MFSHYDRDTQGVVNRQTDRQQQWLEDRLRLRVCASVSTHHRETATSSYVWSWAEDELHL